MKTKKIIPILCATLLLSTAVNISVYAGMFSGSASSTSSENKKKTNVSMTPEQADVPSKSNENSTDEVSIKVKERTIQMKDGTVINLTYAYTEKDESLGTDYYIYLDEEGNDYSYDHKGELISYNAVHGAFGDALAEAESTDSDLLTNEEMLTLARDFASALWGEDFDNFEVSIVQHPEFTENYNMVDVEFSEKFGEGGIAIGRRCSVGVLPTGAIDYYRMGEKRYNEDFDEKILDGLTAEKISEFAEEQARAVYGNDYISSSIVPEILQIVSDGTSHYLDIPTMITYNSGIEDEPSTGVMSFNYEIK